jgi:hypothetical protein
MGKEYLMNTRHLLIASVIGALVTTTFSNAPFLNQLNCLIFLPFWIGPLLAAWFYKYQTGRITPEDGITVGTVTGLFAGFLGFLWVAGGLGLAAQIREYSPSGLMPADLWVGSAPTLFTLAGVLIHAIFGAIGGAIAGVIFSRKKRSTL